MNDRPGTYKNCSVLGVIPARGGSKSLPGKNKKELAGRPLLAYTIDAARGSRYLTSFVVSTDDDELAQIAADSGAPVPFRRPPELAEDTSAGLPVVQHAVRFLESRGEVFDYVAILQPTSPLRTSDDIDQCIRKVVDSDADSVMSMVELVDFSLAKLKRIENDLILPMFEDEGSTTARRQDGLRTYKRNCAIYLTRTELIMRGELFGRVSRPHIMPAERSVDINTAADFDLAEFYVTRQLAASNRK